MNTFERTELKYLITEETRKNLMFALASHIEEDKHGKTTISNIYYDTPDLRLASHSLERPVYKEKLRSRSYKTAEPEDMVFVELKKKYNGIVYKRRVSMEEGLSKSYLSGQIPAPEPCQITNEIDYFLEFYKNLRPTMFISYDREAFFDKADGSLRITFDTNILYRNYDLSLCKAPYGQSLLDKGSVLMEIKAGQAMPLWLTHSLAANQIRKTTFSKYGLSCLKIASKELQKYA